MKITRYLIAICIFSCLAFGQHISTRDVLYTNDGDEFRGELDRVTDSQVFFKTTSEEKVFEREDVVRVEFVKERAGDWWQTVEEIDDPVLSVVLENLPDPANYPGASYVVLYESDEFEISADGTVEHMNRRIIQALNERSKDKVSLAHMLYFSDLGSAEFLHARSISPTGSILHLDESAVEGGPVNAYIPDYNRLALVKCALGEVGPGSVVDIARKTVQKYENALDAFFSVVNFMEEEPIIKKELTLRVESGAQIHYAENNRPEEWPEPVRSDEGGWTIFRWSMENIPPVISESNMPPDARYIPSISISLNPGWDEIASEFSAALDATIDDKAAIEGLAKRLTKGKKGPEKKARAIYEWVVSEVRLVGVPALYYSFSPKKLSTIIENQFANDLDKASLFYALCRESGIDVDFGFASGHGDFFDEGVPALSSVPVPILRIECDGDYIWAAPSSEYRPMGVLPSSIMGEAAVVFGSNGVETTQIPLPKSNDEHNEEFISGKIDGDGNFEGTLRIVYHGSRQKEIREYKQSSEEEIRREMEKRIGKMHPNAQMIEWEIEGLTELDKLPEMIVDFKIDGYAIKAGDKFLAFKIPDLMYSAWGTGKPSRDWPIWFDSPYRGTHDIEIELPKGYVIYHIPGDTLSSADSISYSASFLHEKGELKFFDDYDRARLSFPPDMYAAYQDYRLVQAATAAAWVVLNKK